jgi:hypothetical protein
MSTSFRLGDVLVEVLRDVTFRPLMAMRGGAVAADASVLLDSAP